MLAECFLNASHASVSGRCPTPQIIGRHHISGILVRPRHAVAKRAMAVHAQVEDRPTEQVGEIEEKTKVENGDNTTEKYGLEAGLFKVFTSKKSDEGKSKGDQAKELLARYGGAYLITSISFALVSFVACYALVNAGVDVSALLKQLGLEVNSTSEKVGTAAIAYAAHKALSPVRFPPTVALTPVVARFLEQAWKSGKKEPEGGDSSSV